jgi:hypothetical protein
VEPLLDVKEKSNEQQNTNDSSRENGDPRPTWRKLLGQPMSPHPFFESTTNGAERKILLGPSVVLAIKWIVILILGILLIFKDGSSAAPLLKWLFLK